MLRVDFKEILMYTVEMLKLQSDENMFGQKSSESDNIFLVPLSPVFV